MLLERYYFNHMPPHEKRAYKNIYVGLINRDRTIVINEPVSFDRLDMLYFRVMYDNPTIFYAHPSRIKYTRDYGCRVLYPEYIYTPEQSKVIVGAIKKRLAIVDKKAKECFGDPIAIERHLHDIVARSVSYNKLELDHPFYSHAHSIIGTFLEKKGVCEGISKTFKFLCNLYNLECIVVTGLAEPDGNYTSDSKHAWNLVKLGDDFYHVDVTWNSVTMFGKRMISYKYFNLSTEDILRNHQPDSDLPYCAKSLTKPKSISSLFD